MNVKLYMEVVRDVVFQVSTKAMYFSWGKGVSNRGILFKGSRAITPDDL